MKTIKIVFYTFLFLFYFATEIYAQGDLEYMEYKESKLSFLKLNDSIETGKIVFSLENQRKGSKPTEKNIFTLLFSKENDYIKFNLTDSLNQRQYVCNGHILYSIDHQKKRYGTRIVLSKRNSKSSPLFFPQNMFFDYFIRDEIIKHLPKPIDNKQISVNHDTIKAIGKMKVFGLYSKNSKDSLPALTDANVEIVFEPETMMLKSYRKILTDKKSFKKGTILQSKYTLLSSRINEEIFSRPQYYEGLYYARDYKPFPNDNYRYSKAFYNW